MSSLLAYGQGFLGEDIGSGTGLTEPWAPTVALGDGEGDDESPAVGVKGGSNISLNADPIEVGVKGEGSKAGVEAGAGRHGYGHGQHHGRGGGSGHRSPSDFFSFIQARAPPLKENPAPGNEGDGALGPEAATFPPRSSSTTTSSVKRDPHSVKKDLHWDSPPQSPTSSFLHLPSALLTIISSGTKADSVVVGVFKDRSKSIVETLLFLPRGLTCADYIDFKPDLLKCISGKMVVTEGLELPIEFIKALRVRPQAFLAHRFSVGKYDAIIYGLWKNASQVTPTAEAVFSDAVKSLPPLLSNRLNVRKYERLGRRFDAILKVMPDAVLFVDDECAQVVLNPAAAILLGLPTHGEVEPNKVAIAMRALTDRCSKRMDPQHWMRISSDEHFEIEEDWELKMPRRVLHVRSYPVTSHFAHGRFWIYEDVTSQRDAELAMEEATKAKSRFLAMMSHELRTPMTGVLGMLDLLHLTNLEEEQQDLVQIMQESADGLMDVINNILDYCKIEAGRLQLEEIDFSLTDMFERIQTMSKTSFMKKELDLSFSGGPSDISVIRGDPVRLRQIIVNLVSNAIKFTKDGSVAVSWRFLDSQLEDTTVVATSQASGKSRPINQIINASRGEKSRVEHLTTATGRSVIVVNCSSTAGGVGVGPYLESGGSSSGFRPPVIPAAPFTAFHLQQRLQPPSPFQRDQQDCNQHQPLTTVNHSTLSSTDSHRHLCKKSNCSCSGLLSFHAAYSSRLENQPLCPPAAAAAAALSQSFETRNSFLQEKNIEDGGSDPSKEPNVSSALQQQQRLRRTRPYLEDPTPTPFTEKPLILDPLFSMDNYGVMRSLKYPRLPLQIASWNPPWMISSLGALAAPAPAADNNSSLLVHEGEGLQSLSQPNLYSPQWRVDLGADGHISSIPAHATVARVPFGRTGGSRSRSRVGAATNKMSSQHMINEQHEWQQRFARGGTRPLGSAGSSMGSNESENSGMPTTPMDTTAGEARAKGKESSSGPPWWNKLQDWKLFRESKADEEEKTSYVKPKDRVWLEVTVSDTGVGIGKDWLDRLFEGSQAGSQRMNAAGTGLGLSICKGLLCLLNGKIKFDSKIGEGTTVLVTVPLLPAAEKEDVRDLVVPAPPALVMNPRSMPGSSCSLAPASSSAAPALIGEEVSTLVASTMPSSSSYYSSSVNDESGLAPMQWTSAPTESNSMEPTTYLAAAAEQTAAPAANTERCKVKRQLFITEEDNAPSAAGTITEGRQHRHQLQIENPLVFITDEANGKKVQVLLAEDNKVNQLLIRKMLMHFGHETEIVGNGKLAVEAVQRRVFDLVLMDVQMPILDGVSATKVIKGLPPPVSQIPVYALSADALESKLMEETGLDGFLKKPVDWNVMAALIAKISSAKNA